MLAVGKDGRDRTRRIGGQQTRKGLGTPRGMICKRVRSQGAFQWSHSTCHNTRSSNNNNGGVGKRSTRVTLVLSAFFGRNRLLSQSPHQLPRPIESQCKFLTRLQSCWRVSLSLLHLVLGSFLTYLACSTFASSIKCVTLS